MPMWVHRPALETWPGTPILPKPLQVSWSDVTIRANPDVMMD